MIIIYFGVYTLFLVIIWGFFIVAKIHAYKFKTFSYSIQKVTSALMIFLGVLSILGYIVLAFAKDFTQTFDLNITTTQPKSEIIY